MKQDEQQQTKVQQVQSLPGLSVPTTVIPYTPYYGGGVYYDPYHGTYRRRHGHIRKVVGPLAVVSTLF